MKNDLFDNSIKEKLDGHEAPVPSDAWANIQKGKKKRRPLPFFWLLAGLLLCGGAGIYIFNNNGETKETKFAEQTIKEDVKHTSTQKEQEEVPGKIDDITPQKNNDLPADENKISKTADSVSTALTSDQAVRIISSSSKNKNNNTDVSAVVSDNKKDHKPLKRNYFTGNKKGRISLAVTNANITDTEDDEENINSKRSKKSTSGKVAMQVTAPAANKEDNKETIVFKEQEPIYTIDSITTLANKETAKVALNEKPADTTVLILSGETAGKKTVDNKKKKKAGIDIDMGISGFMPSANKVNIASVSRTTVEPLHKAEFTADKVRIRLQPSVGFNLSLFKSLSGKAAIGAGLGYQVVKEYIQLSGEEVNTNYTIVKRLNGTVLIDDTVTTITKGVRNIDAVNSYTLLSIPVSFRYQLLQRSQWAMALQAGIDISLQTSYKNSIGGQLVPQFSNAGNRKRNTSIGTGFNLALRMSRRVGKNYLLYASPYFQLNPATLYLKDMLAPAKMNRAGISFGVTIRP